MYQEDDTRRNKGSEEEQERRSKAGRGGDPRQDVSVQRVQSQVFQGRLLTTRPAGLLYDGHEVRRDPELRSTRVTQIISTAHDKEIGGGESHEIREIHGNSENTLRKTP